MINDKIKVMENVMMPVSEEIQDKMNDFMNRIHKDLTDTFGAVGQGVCYDPQYSWLHYKGKEYVQENLGTFACYSKDDTFKLMIHLKDAKSIGIHYIEVEKQGNGIGTDIMNIILDICDDMKLNVDVCASAFKSEYAHLKYNELNKKQKQVTEIANQRLRAWYKSFGFKSDIFKPFLMKYLAS